MVVKLNERIADLEEKLQQFRTRQQRILARKRDRAADTRRKILVGAIVLAKAEQGVLTESQLRQWLDGAPRRADDRALFGL